MIKERKSCTVARKALVDKYDGAKVEPAAMKEAERHIKACPDCAIQGAKFVRSVLVGEKIKVSHAECLKNMDKYLDYRLSSDKSKSAALQAMPAELFRVQNHVYYCRDCYYAFLAKYEFSKAENATGLLEIPKFDLSFLKKKISKPPVIKMILDVAGDTIKIIRATGKIISEMAGELQPPMLKPATAVMFAPSNMPEPHFRKNSVEIEQVINRDTICRIRVSLPKNDLYPVEVALFNVGTHNKRLPVPGLLLSVHLKSVPTTPKITNTRGYVSYRLRRGTYAISIDDNYDKLAAIDLRL